MMADTPLELLAIVDMIGVRRKWLQHSGTYREHFDICKAKRVLAVKAGAVELTSRELLVKMKEKQRTYHQGE